MTGQTYEDGDTVTYSYDNNGAMAKMKDSATGITTTYHYDLSDRLAKYTESGSGYSHSVSYTYDKLNNLTDLEETVNGTTHLTTYTYDDDNRVICKITGLLAVYYSYDALGRVTQQVTKHGSATVKTETYTYYGNSTQVASHAVTANGTTSTTTYTYDGNGNILSISDGTNTTSYAYDTANQLVRENNQAADYTRVWGYNNAGNIEVHRTFDYTTGEVDSSDYTAIVDYQYTNTNWNDLLTNYNGSAFSYDAIGNLTNDGTWVYTWEHGRELTQMSKSGATWTYTYDADGMRTKRTNGTDTYTYVYNGSQLTQMTKGSDTLYFTYDASGTPVSVTHTNGSTSVTYYYVTNLQGDVMHLFDANGTTAGYYIYDAWGNQISMGSSTICQLNPLRYRGYVYDQETELYYLQSRYYNPEWGRFINADGFVSTGQGFVGRNTFVYCLNNPVEYIDNNGQRAGHAKAIAKRKRIIAERKYNEETIHIFLEQTEIPASNKLNVMLRPHVKEIFILDSANITDPYEVYAVLDVVFAHPLYDTTDYVTDKSQAADEWMGHNFVHSITNTIPSSENLFDRMGYPNANIRTKDVNINKTLSITERIAYGIVAMFDTIVRGFLK